MLNAVIVILRETLEASLLIGLMLIYSNLIKTHTRWLITSLASALLLAFIFAKNMHIISDWQEGIGQELLFASLLFIIAISILILNIAVLIASRQSDISRYSKVITLLLMLSIFCAVSLEGSEIIIYLEAVQFQSEGIYATIVGGLLGTGIGVSVGVICHYGIRFFPQYQINIVFFLLTLVSAGMLTQSAAYISQAGIIDAGLAIWSSESLISESSLTGQLLYALIGYESRPTLIQIIVYFVCIIVSTLSFLGINFYLKKQPIISKSTNNVFSAKKA